MLQMNLIKNLKTSFEIRISHDFRWLCHNTNNKTIVYDMNTWEEVVVLNKPTNPSRIKFSGNDEYLIIKNTNGGIWVYKTGDFQLLNILKSKKSYKLIDQGFAFTQDNKMILDIMETKLGNQIVTLNIDSGEKRILTSFKNSLISYNHYSTKEKFHLFNLNFVNDQTGYREYKLIKVNEPVTVQSIQVISNQEILQWDQVIFNSLADTYILVNDYEIAIVDSDFKFVLKKVTLVETKDQDDTGHFEHMNLSNNGKFIVLTYSKKIFILDFGDLKTIAIEKFSYACFAEFSKDDNYLLIGTWDNSYVLKNNLF